ncbi:MAG: hypothetical protein JJU28_02205 [Cyclobacteriaceae bacterium]|nr:hypothetical protein [Cyclobacteriaceae bacterium]
MSFKRINMQGRVLNTDSPGLGHFRGKYINIGGMGEDPDGLVLIERKGVFDKTCPVLREELRITSHMIAASEARIVLAEHNDFHLSNEDMIEWLLTHWYQPLSVAGIDLEVIVDTDGNWKNIAKMIEKSSCTISTPLFSSLKEARCFVKEYSYLQSHFRAASNI